MKSLIKDLLVAGHAPQLWQKIRHPRALTILCYHAITKTPRPVYNWCFHPADCFRNELMYLKRHFEVLPLLDAVDKLEADKVDQPTAVVTFDDGYQDNHDVAFPILKELSIPATIFLTTDLLDTNEGLWDTQLHAAIERAVVPSITWRDTRYDLLDARQKAETSRRLRDDLKQYPYDKLLPELHNLLILLESDPSHTFDEDSPYRMLRTKSIKSMADSGLITFGAHGSRHAILSNLDTDTKRSFIETSLGDVQRVTGRACDCFAFPNGRAQDYDQACLDVLRDKNVKAAVTMIKGPNRPDTPLLELRRYGVAAQSSRTDFCIQVHHFRSI